MPFIDEIDLGFDFDKKKESKTIQKTMPAKKLEKAVMTTKKTAKQDYLEAKRKLKGQLEEQKYKRKLADIKTAQKKLEIAKRRQQVETAKSVGRGVVKFLKKKKGGK